MRVISVRFLAPIFRAAERSAPDTAESETPSAYATDQASAALVRWRRLRLRARSTSPETALDARRALRKEVLHDPELAVGRGRDAARHASVAHVGHVDVVAVGGAGAGAFGEHHRQAAVDDVGGRAGPAGAFVLGALAALAERTVCGA